VSSEETKITPAEDGNPFAPSVQIKTEGSLTAIEAVRAQAEVQGAIVSAKRFPRDPFTSWNRIAQGCKRPKLASQALYAYPRGDTTVTGPSIRLAEVLAQAWGNVSFGIRELEQRDSDSTVEAYCTDLETNVTRSVVFQVPHERHTKRGVYKLEDPRDIYELVANQGARRVRACILAVIPGDIVDLAVAECKRTQLRGEGEPLEDRIRKMVQAFAEVGVPQDAIEKRLGHPMAQTVAEEIVDLQAIYRAVKENFAARHDFFEMEGAKTAKTVTLTQKILNGGKATTVPQADPLSKTTNTLPDKNRILFAEDDEGQ
jgi:hypothetical protein